MRQLAARQNHRMEKRTGHRSAARFTTTLSVFPILVSNLRPERVLEDSPTGFRDDRPSSEVRLELARSGFPFQRTETPPQGARAEPLGALSPSNAYTQSPSYRTGISPRPARPLRRGAAAAKRMRFACCYQHPRGDAGLKLSHRPRARCEDRIRNARATGLRNLPLHDFSPNQIWLEIGLLLSLRPERVQDGRGEPDSPDTAPVQRGSRTPPQRIPSSLRADVGAPAGRSHWHWRRRERHASSDVMTCLIRV